MSDDLYEGSSMAQKIPQALARSPEYSVQRGYSILRLPAVKARTGLSRSTIYKQISEGTFPKPVSLSVRAVGWVESHVEDWLQARIDESRKAAA